MLRDGQLHVASAGGQVEHEHVEAAPVDFVEQLLEGFHDHEAAPYDGGVFADEVAHGHGFDAIVGEGDELVVFGETVLEIEVRLRGVNFDY